MTKRPGKSTEPWRQAWARAMCMKAASLRWGCPVELYRQGRKTIVCHGPGVMRAIRGATPEDAA